jgi:hypothetical protein
MRRARHLPRGDGQHNPWVRPQNGQIWCIAPAEAFAFRDGGEACSPTTKGRSAASAGRHNRKASEVTARALP